MPAFVVSIDGTDFSGKTTVANLIIEYLRPILRNSDVSVKKTELPSSLITGSFTKILRNSADEVSQKVFALAYALDHLHHYESFIRPLEKSDRMHVVIQERSLLTTLLYQGIIGTVDFKWLRTINSFDLNIPHLTLILKVPGEEILKRKAIENSSRGFDKFENVDFLKKELKTYYNLPKNLETEFHVKYVDIDNEEARSIAQRCAHIIAAEVEKFYKLNVSNLKKFQKQKK